MPIRRRTSRSSRRTGSIVKEFTSTEDLLDFAIRQEEVSASFYRGLAGKVSRHWVAKMFEELSVEEDHHREKLIDVKSGSIAALPTDRVSRLGLAGVLSVADPTSDLSFPDALVLAMTREDAAFTMYTRLAEIATDPELAGLLRGLAHEEAGHRLRIETEYDEHVLTQG